MAEPRDRAGGSRPIDRSTIEIARAAMLPAAGDRLARRLLEALADPTRLKILRALRATPLAAGDLAELVARTRSATSQHLRVLREVDAVVAERKGNVVLYRLATTTAAAVLAEAAAAFDQLRAA